MIDLADSASSFKARSAPANRADRITTAREEALHDAALVNRFSRGDETAFVEIMTRYRAKMFSVAFAVLRNRADTEEIVQDTFIRAHRGLARFRGDGALAGWLHRIALNLARNRYWYFFRRRRHATLSLDCALSDDSQTTFSDLMATDAAGPARAAVAREFSELISVCMQRLGTQSRQILTLRNSLHRSYAEIAQELGISVGTVKSRIGRARTSLRLLLTEACPEFGPETEPMAWFDPVRPAGGMATLCA